MLTDEKVKVKIDFNEPHIAYKNSKGERVVGVTTALNLLAKPALVPWAYKRGLAGFPLYETTDKAANIGTIIHSRILAYFKGYKIDNSNISLDVWQFTENSMKSFFEWAAPRNINPIIVEKPIVSDIYQYGGTPDIFGIMDGKPTLLDFKTGSGLYEEHFVQLAAYLQLILESGENPEKIIVLNIPKTADDSFTLKSISANDPVLKLRFQKFLKLVEIWNLDNQITKYKEVF